MDEVMTALVEIQTLCSGIGADENHAVPRPEQLGYFASLGFFVLAAHGEYLLQLCILESINRSALAVDVLCVDENTRVRLFLANVPNCCDKAVEFGVMLHSPLG